MIFDIDVIKNELLKILYFFMILLFYTPVIHPKEDNLSRFMETYMKRDNSKAHCLKDM